MTNPPRSKGETATLKNHLVQMNPESQQNMPSPSTSRKNDSDATQDTQNDCDDRGEEQAEKKDDDYDTSRPQHEQPFMNDTTSPLGPSSSSSSFRSNISKRWRPIPSSVGSSTNDKGGNKPQPPSPPFFLHDYESTKLPSSSSDNNLVELKSGPSLRATEDENNAYRNRNDRTVSISTNRIRSSRASSANSLNSKLANDNGDREGSSEKEEKEGKKEDDKNIDEDDRNQDSSKEEDSWFWKSRLFIGRTVNHEYVQITIIILIVINAFMMGLATMDWVTDSPRIEHVFMVIDKAFLVVFSLEVAMQLYYLGIALFQDGWLIFDLLIVVFSWSFETLQIVRAFRIFRAFRLITRVKPLRDLVLAIGAVLPRMYAIAALLLIIFYVFAVLFTELFSDLPLSDNYFQTLDASLFTCMEMMTLEWASLAREVIEYRPWAWAPFTFFIAISGFIVYNLIVAVVVEAVAVTEQTVRALDGLEPNSPSYKLEEAEERIDVIRYHLEDMMRTQEQIQSMLEVMAGEMMYLETERMRAESREMILRNEINRRMEYQRTMELTSQTGSSERSFQMERERRESVRKEKLLSQAAEKEKLETLGHSLGGSQSSLHNDVPRSPRSSRAVRRGSTGTYSNKSPVAAQTRLGSSLRSIGTKSASSRSNASSVEDGNSAERSWKRFLAFQSQLDR